MWNILVSPDKSRTTPITTSQQRTPKRQPQLFRPCLPSHSRHAHTQTPHLIMLVQPGEPHMFSQFKRVNRREAEKQGVNFGKLGSELIDRLCSSQALKIWHRPLDDLHLGLFFLLCSTSDMHLHLDPNHVASHHTDDHSSTTGVQYYATLCHRSGDALFLSSLLTHPLNLVPRFTLLT